MKTGFQYIQDKHLYGFGKCLAKVSGTINHTQGFSTVTRFESGNIISQWQSDSISENEVDNAMRAILMLPFSSGPKLEIEWKVLK